MNRYLLLLCLLCPLLVCAQIPGMKNGTISIDFGKKKHKQHDSIPQQDYNDEDSVSDYKKLKKQQSALKKKEHIKDSYDFKKDGIFRALFHIGINAAQVDGDNEWGYKQPGAEGGVGAMARFHKYLSVSMEINYSMEGARARLASTDQQLMKYQVQWDYIQTAIALNGHYKDVLMLRMGLTPEVMVRYKEYDYNGIDVTANPPLGQPRKFGMEAFGGAYVILKKHYAIGAKYSYSILKIRGAYDMTRVSGQTNNLFNFSFMYILGAVRKK